MTDDEGVENTSFRGIVEGLPLVVYVDELDEHSSCTYISPKIQELLGYTPEEWVADNQLFARSLHPDDAPRVLAEVAQRNTSGISTPAETYRLIAKDGSVVWVQDDEVVVRDADGRPLRAQGYLQDITDRHQAQTRLELLVGILGCATEGATPGAVIGRAVEILGERFDDLRVGFLRVEGNHIYLVQSTDPRPWEHDLLDDDVSSWAVAAYAAGRSVIVSDIELEDRLDDKDWFRTRSIRSYADVPLRVGEKLVGVLSFESARPRRWTESDVRTFEEVAEQLAVVLSDARAREARVAAESDLRRRDAILEAMSRASQELLEAPSWLDVAPSVLEWLGEAADVSRAYVFENIDEGEVPFTRPVATWHRDGWSALPHDPAFPNEESRHFERWAELLAGGVVVGGVTASLPEDERVFFERISAQAVIAVPIFVGGDWWGFIGFEDCEEPRAWSPAEQETLATAASIIGAAISRVQAESVLREHEHKLRAVFESSLDAIYITDDDRRYVDVNAAACELLGIAKRDLIGRRIDEFMPPEDRASVEPYWERFRDAQPTIEEWKSLRADGELRDVEASTRPNFLPGLHIAFLRDITDRKRLEAELLSSQKLESIGRLAGGVAHDFNNLLTAITGYTTLLLERAQGSGDELLAGDLGEIYRAAERAAALTRQLLAFGRRQVLQPRVLDLNATLEDIGKLLHRLIGAQVELELELQDGVGRIRADPGQIDQVIVNLAVNARDAMPSGGRLTLSTRDLTCPDGDFVELRVSDTGLGMDETTQAQIFEPFFTTREDGVGLGLASVYGIVSQSGGSIIVESAPGEGTCFRILFPRVEAESIAAPATLPAVPRSTSSGTGTILLVEDEEVVRALTRRVLERCGYDVLACANGAEAIAVAQGHEAHIDLLLTDVVMPGLRGPEVAERVAASRPEIKVLYMSGYADEALLGRAAIDGSALISKPFAVDALARRVKAELEGRSPVPALD